MQTETRSKVHNQLTMHPGAPLNGEAQVPGDKSLSHRAALFAAMAEGESKVSNFLISGVTQAMLDALTGIGVQWNLDGNDLSVEGIGLRPKLGEDQLVINCGNSGTTMRLLAGALAAWNIPAVLDGSEGLRRRPMGRIIKPLRRMGVQIDANDDCAPLIIQPIDGRLDAIQYDMPVASAQVKSCLLLAALSADGETILREPGPSRDHTERMLESMGASVTSTRSVGDFPYETRLVPPGSHKLNPLSMALPGDISAAAFLIIAALITPGSEVSLRRIGLNPTRTGLLDALEMMGAELVIKNRFEQGGEPLGDLAVRYSRLRGIQIDGELVVRMIDEFPAFAVAAAFAHGETVVREAVELRHKESDRIHVICTQLERLGVDISETPDGFIIQGGAGIDGGEIDPHGDHRLAMALSVAGLASNGPITVQNAAIIHESFPAFSDVLTKLGAKVTHR